MKITIDTDAALVTVDQQGAPAAQYPLGSADGFAAVSKAWVRSGWDTKYVYSFTWFGRPIMQLPEDMIRLAEVIYTLKPDVIVETGIAHGGSLVFYASLFKAMGKGRVIGIDIDIRAHNRAAIESHELASYLTMIEGSSVDAAVVDQVKALIKPDEVVLVLLDSNHLRDHVAAELTLYSPLVSVGSYIVACDGIMKEVVGAPRSSADWSWNNPQSAVTDFLADSKNFRLEYPSFVFNEGVVDQPITYWPNAWLKRVA
jgi:cephalosporin hydroxylase